MKTTTKTPTPPPAAKAPTTPADPAHLPLDGLTATQAQAHAEALDTSRGKLSRLIEMYSPTHLGRDGALAALNAGVEEFEAAVRGDERAKAGIVSNDEQPAPAAPSFPDGGQKHDDPLTGGAQRAEGEAGKAPPEAL